MSCKGRVKADEACVIEQEMKPTLLKVIDPKQFGLILDSCTNFSLISMLHNWLEATDGTDSCVRTALLGYKKAFDLVDHRILIGKLFSVGIKSSVVNWLIEFLRG